MVEAVKQWIPSAFDGCDFPSTKGSSTVNIDEDYVVSIEDMPMDMVLNLRDDGDSRE